MARYAFDGETVTLYLTNGDVELLDSLSEQLIELLVDSAPASPEVDPDDPFAMWEADLAHEPEDSDPPEDPALQRLFPNPYPNDARAAFDFRRYTESDNRRAKIEDARTLRRGLAEAPPIRIPKDQVDPWLRTLNALRLVLASRLGIDDEDAMDELHEADDSDPRALMGGVMDWLAYLQGVIIELVMPGLE